MKRRHFFKALVALPAGLVAAANPPEVKCWRVNLDRCKELNYRPATEKLWTKVYLSLPLWMDEFRSSNGRA